MKARRIHDLYRFFGARFRSKRMAAFLDAYRAGGGGSILDVGGTVEFWADQRLATGITIVNLAPSPGGLPANVEYVQGSATALPFEDDFFDVVFSNSMIEHLGGRANQERFAREARRVGRRVWIQTPNRWFPIEPHVLTPFIHYLPRAAQRRLLRNLTVWGWLTRPDHATVENLLDELCLLSAGDLLRLFPGSELIRERVLGMTKSLIAVDPPILGSATGHRQRVDVLGVGISVTSIDDAVETIASWIENGERRYVTCTPVSGVMASQGNDEVRAAHNESGLTVPDGMPMVWAGKLAGARNISRVYGPDLMERMCALAAQRGWRCFLYGGEPGVPEELGNRLSERFPGLNVVGTFSPPFRPLTDAESAEVTEMINSSGAELVWVGISTPKQELWMAEHVGRLEPPAVLIGVGAAFDVHSGRVRRPPRWMGPLGLYWLFRLLQEPRRLWRRYLVGNARFLAAIMRRRPYLRDDADQ